LSDTVFKKVDYQLSKLVDDIELDVVAGSPREVGPKPAISNSFGFGGHNACLVLAAAD